MLYSIQALDSAELEIEHLIQTIKEAEQKRLELEKDLHFNKKTLQAFAISMIEVEKRVIECSSCCVIV